MLFVRYLEFLFSLNLRIEKHLIIAIFYILLHSHSLRSKRTWWPWDATKLCTVEVFSEGSILQLCLRYVWLPASSSKNIAESQIWTETEDEPKSEVAIAQSEVWCEQLAETKLRTERALSSYR